MKREDLNLNYDEPLAWAVFGDNLRINGDLVDYAVFWELEDAESCVDESATEEGGEDRVIVPLYPRKPEDDERAMKRKKMVGDMIPKDDRFAKRMGYVSLQDMKNFDMLQKQIDELKARVDRIDGRTAIIGGGE